MRIGLCGPSYESQSPSVATQRTVNLYPERVEYPDGKTGIAMYPLPGLKEVCDLTGDSDIRCLFQEQATSRVFVVGNINICELDSAGTLTLRGTLGAQTTSSIVTTASSPEQLLICAGGVLYTYDLAINNIGVPVALGALLTFSVQGAGYAHSISINGTPYSYVEVGGDTAANIATQLYTLVNAGAGNIDMVAQNATAGEVFLYRKPDRTTISVSASDDNDTVDVAGPFEMCAFVDGYGLALKRDSQEFWVSDLNDVKSWNALDKAQVSFFPDKVNSLFVDHREVWLFGNTKTIVYYNSGATFPFEPNPPACIEQGIAAKYSPARLDNSVFWLGGDERGAGVVWRAQGYAPVRVSTHALEHALRSYSTLSDAIGYSWQDEGHAFYRLYFPTANTTWEYDCSTQTWHQVRFDNAGTGAITAHRSKCHVYAFGKHLVGDWADGKVYDMSPRWMDDFGNAIHRIRRSAHLSNEQDWTYYSSLQVDLEIGALNAGWREAAAYDGGTAYIDGDSVTYLGGTFGCIKASTGNLPTDTTYWVKLYTWNGTWTETAYGTNAVVHYGGSLYYCTVATTTEAPTDTGHWAAFGRITLRWSDDGGHTWSSDHTISPAVAAQYKARAIWRRLGRSRDRVYEIEASDNLPWRFVDAYVKGAA